MISGQLLSFLISNMEVLTVWNPKCVKIKDLVHTYEVLGTASGI